MTITCKKSKLVFEDYSGLVWENPEIKLFKIKLSDFESGVDHLLAYLETKEVERANRYHFKKDRYRFIICRAILKILLAKKTNLEVSTIKIRKDENKKPYLFSHPSVFFNVSHTDDCALIAIANNIVGIDVEKINPSFHYYEILEHVFASQEIEKLINSKFPIREFYTFWTRKEAIVKAMGSGINNLIKEIPTTDGHHSCNIPHIPLNVLSFVIEEDNVGSIAFAKDSKEIENILCFEIGLHLVNCN